MRYLKLFLFFCLFLPIMLIADCIDLEESYFNPALKETKRILIPGFPNAFNPSLIRWKGKYLLSFRAGKEYQYEDMTPQEPHPDESPDPDYFESSRQTDTPPYSPNRIGLIWLDSKFQPISKPQILDLPNDNPTYRQQDPRLVLVAGRVFILFSDVVKGTLIDQTRRMCAAELFYEKNHFFVEKLERLEEFEGIRDQRWEKNWVPFDYDDNLLLAYSINPHKIFFPLMSQGICCTVASTKCQIDWPWGELRGGTPAVLMDGEYLAFFHSSQVMASKQSENKNGHHYFMGAYTFSAEPPFQLTRISPMPIVGKNFYGGSAYKTWKPNLQVIFPGGIVADKKFIYVAYGRQDHEVWIAKFDKEELYQSLIAVKSLENSVVD